MHWLFLTCLTFCVAMEPEPESDLSFTTTNAREPEIDRSESLSTSIEATTTRGEIGHSLQVIVDLHSLRHFLSQTAFEAKVLEGISNATRQNVSITLHNIKVAVSYSNLPDISSSFTEDHIIQGIARANGVETAAVAISTVGSRRLARRSLARQLATTASAVITINNTADFDVIQKAQDVMTSSQNTSALAEAIEHVTGNDCDQPMLQTVPSAKIFFKTSIVGGSNVKLDATQVQTAVASIIGGTVTVQQMDHPSTTASVTTTNETMPNVTTTDRLEPSDNAAASSLISIWALACAFALN